ncbi:UNVERIFIED_CONTAM: hypothetical protein FKN15_066235 [Acipenser sinensis]
MQLWAAYRQARRRPARLQGSLLCVLLDALTRNGNSAGSGASCRKPTDSTDGGKSRKESNSSGAGETAKSFTKDQVEGVQSIGSGDSGPSILLSVVTSQPRYRGPAPSHAAFALHDSSITLE